MPRIGMRLIKTVVAVWLLVFAYASLDTGRTAFYAVIAAILCIQSDLSNSRKVASNRVVGTLIGAFYGGILLIVQHQVLWERDSFLDTLLVTLGFGLTIYSTVVFKKSSAAFIACISFGSIVIAHRGDVNPYIFIVYRVFDTILGIALAYFINWIHLPRRRNKDILFVSGLDDTLVSVSDEMSPYTKVDLNRMLSEGVLFTIATGRTPASMMAATQDIHLKLPVIAMDGAAVYDVQENRYIKEENIDYETACQIEDLLKQYALPYFINLIIQDVMLIFYPEPPKGVQGQFYEKYRRSPYRNYIYGTPPENRDVVYFSILNTEEKLRHLEEELEKLPIFEKLRVRWEKTEYPGHFLMKILSAEATKEHMISWLRKELGVDRVMTFGTVEGKYDVLIKPGNMNKVVRTVKAEFEPLIWKRK
ncbi:MAG: HAD hydrolase family protein [Lachnospiraceae bacterium]|nr:HAD hydrolase family protein [Lachnospiraceae bacterium]